MTEFTPITLEQLLSSRDARVEYQKKLTEQFPGASLICLTVILPGPVKRDDRSLIIGADGAEAVQKAFEGHVLYKEIRDLVTGFEGYFVVNVPVPEAKRICCGIEDTHLLGRLMDIDVIADGPVSRTSIGLPERRCLLCDKPARECMRAHTHSAQAIQETIDKIIQKRDSSK